MRVFKPKVETVEDTATVCCAECGSIQVEYAVWHDPNTGVTGDVFGSWNAGDNTFCVCCDIEGRDCNAPLVDKGADPQLFRKARAKYKREHKE